MLKTFKILLLILGLGIYLFPSPMAYVQKNNTCCAQPATDIGCCNSDKEEPCHSATEQRSDKNTCGMECMQCQLCSFHVMVSHLASETNTSLPKQFFIKEFNFSYGNSYHLSSIHNIWQPPKIG